MVDRSGWRRIDSLRRCDVLIDGLCRASLRDVESPRLADEKLLRLVDPESVFDGRRRSTDRFGDSRFAPDRVFLSRCRSLSDRFEP